MLSTDEHLKRRIVQLEAELRELNQGVGSSAERTNPAVAGLDMFLVANSMAVMRASVDGEIWEANDAFIELIGYDREELLSGRVGWADITVPEHVAKDAKATRELASKGVTEPYEKTYIHKDGHHIPVLLSVTSSDSEGKDCFCFVVDLTESKKREAELSLSEAQFRTLTEAMPQMVFVCDSDGQVEYFNQHWSDRTGIDRTPGHQNRWIETIHPDHLEIVESLPEAMRQGKIYEGETKYRTNEGQYNWCLVRAVPLKNARGEVTKWLGTSTDINDQKEVEQRLRESELKFRTLADAIPQIVWTADPSGNIDFINHRWTEYTGLSIEQSLNDGWKLLIHPDDSKSYLDRWDNALESGATFEATFRLRRALGIKGATGNPYRKHLLRAVPLRGLDGRVLKWFATWTEIEHTGNTD